MPEEEVSQIQLPLSKRLLQPNSLKRIVIGVSGLILLIVLIYVFKDFRFAGRDKNEPYWFEEYKSFALTSYKNPHYGTFFSSVKVDLAFINPDVRGELIERKAEVIDKIIDVISGQNYFKINTRHKRRNNLTPELIKRINRLLRTSGGIVNIDYPNFNVKRNNEIEFEEISYFNLGTFKKVKILGKPYEFEVYLIYQSANQLFDQLLKDSKLELQDKISKQLKDEHGTFKNSFIRSAQDTIRSKIIRKQTESLFKKLNIKIKERYNNYEAEQGKLNSIFFSLFVEEKELKP